MRYFAFAFLVGLAFAVDAGAQVAAANGVAKTSFADVKPLVEGPAEFEKFWGANGDNHFVANFIKAAERSSRRSLTGLEKTRIETRIMPRFKRLTYEAWLDSPETDKVVKRIEEMAKQHAKEMAEMLK